jgi:hypothetical protein
MSASVVDELGEASKYLEDAVHASKNAAALLERVSDSMADDVRSAMGSLDEVRSRSRRALDTLESL